VEVVSGNTEPRNDVEDQQLAGRLTKNPKLRLACQVKVSDNLVVKTHV
jgi:ferredoxin